MGHLDWIRILLVSGVGKGSSQHGYWAVSCSHTKVTTFKEGGFSFLPLWLKQLETISTLLQHHSLIRGCLVGRHTTPSLQGEPVKAYYYYEAQETVAVLHQGLQGEPGQVQGRFQSLSYYHYYYARAQERSLYYTCSRASHHYYYARVPEGHCLHRTFSRSTRG